MRAITIVAIAALAAAYPRGAVAQEQPAGVTTDVVSTRKTAETVAVFGQVVAGRESAVAARVPGIAHEVPLQVGDTVAEGDVLARMDTELLEIELAQAQSEIAIAEAGIAVAMARLDRAEKAYRRAESLRANSTISEAQLEDTSGLYAEAVGSRQEAEARISAARNALERARYNIENATVRAPFDGVVLDLATQVGQFVAAGSEVATLVDTSAMEVEANVPARYVTALRPGAELAARTDAGGELGLSMRAALPREYSATRTRPVRFVITTPAAAVAVGQSVTLKVPVSETREVVVVPKDALVQAGDGWSVFVHSDGMAEQRTVTLGAALAGGFEVLSGLVPGDEVVVRGNERLRPGQPIAPTPLPAPDRRAEAEAGGEAETQ